MKTKEDFYAFLNNNINEIKRTDSYSASHKTNCIGTALYLVGEQSQDENVDAETESIFSRFTESATPETGYLVGWIDKWDRIYHAAVITKTTPLRVANRHAIGEHFSHDSSFNETNELHTEEMRGYFKETKYFIPSKLQKIINMEAQN
jgi:hypothetical protein